MATTAGFSPINLRDITINGNSITTHYQLSIINIYIQRTVMGVSTLTMQLMDPNRVLLRDVIKQGDELVLDGLHYILIQTMKASDQVQLVFQAKVVYMLSQQHGAKTYPTGYGVTPFFKELCAEVGAQLVAPDYATIWGKITKIPIFKLVLARGTSSDANESSWVCMNRIASSIGWRLWESDGIIYFGPDEYWLGTISGMTNPPINENLGTIGNNFPILREFTTDIQLIDFDWDVGKPFAQANVTCLLDSFAYKLGEIVKLEGMGVANGYWMVYSIQRDMFNPQATLVLQVPIPLVDYIQPTSLPVAGLPLQPLKVLTVR